jgi:hypothetical protein
MGSSESSKNDKNECEDPSISIYRRCAYGSARGLFQTIVRRFCRVRHITSSPRPRNVYFKNHSDRRYTGDFATPRCCCLCEGIACSIEKEIKRGRIQSTRNRFATTVILGNFQQITFAISSRSMYLCTRVWTLHELPSSAHRCMRNRQEGAGRQGWESQPGSKSYPHHPTSQQWRARQSSKSEAT